METLTYSERAVAFVDLLGFKNLVRLSNNSAAALAELQLVVSTLDRIIPGLNEGVDPNVPEWALPKQLYVSDCVIISAPLRSHTDWNPDYNGVEIVAMRCIQLAHVLLAAGHLVRGGVAVGPMWHGLRNVVGQPYVDAYTKEQSTNKPRIELCQSAINHLEATGGLGPAQPTFRTYDDSVIVNTLLDAYAPNRHVEGQLGRTYALYEQLIRAKINDRTLSPGQRDKWEWLGEFYAAERPHFDGYIAAGDA